MGRCDSPLVNSEECEVGGGAEGLWEALQGTVRGGIQTLTQGWARHSPSLEKPEFSNLGNNTFTSRN